MNVDERAVEAVKQARTNGHPQWGWGDILDQDDAQRLVRPVLLFEQMCPNCAGPVEPVERFAWCPSCNLSWKVRTVQRDDVEGGALACTVRRGRGLEVRCPRRQW